MSNFTVTHYGVSKEFNSIYAAMRYAISIWQHKPNIWSTTAPIWSCSKWIDKKQNIQAKRMK